MNVNQKIIIRILDYIKKMNNDEEFKNNSFDAFEYLVIRTRPDIKAQRLNNILNGKAKRITLQEICIICDALNIELTDLFKGIE